ncbi:hypothetical protein M231_02440 [Tremella mesenterica]|uniref:DUF7923 domain-containing protein n=1 Tax=Tremella mesenterica TaxID=5217 RepID=A0A4Q1BQV7_TREME|nr:hypothetical protein M231_02440 [Tremella mesenterica]
MTSFDLIDLSDLADVPKTKIELVKVATGLEASFEGLTLHATSETSTIHSSETHETDHKSQAKDTILSTCPTSNETMEKPAILADEKHAPDDDHILHDEIVDITTTLSPYPLPDKISPISTTSPSPQRSISSRTASLSARAPEFRPVYVSSVPSPTPGSSDQSQDLAPLEIPLDSDLFSPPVSKPVRITCPTPTSNKTAHTGSRASPRLGTSTPVANKSESNLVDKGAVIGQAQKTISPSSPSSKPEIEQPHRILDVAVRIHSPQRGDPPHTTNTITVAQEPNSLVAQISSGVTLDREMEKRHLAQRDALLLGLTELSELDSIFVDYRDAHSVFIGGLEEISYRLNLVLNQAMSDKPLTYPLESLFPSRGPSRVEVELAETRRERGELQESLSQVRALLDSAHTDLAAVRIERDHLRAKERLWELREEEVAARLFQAEKEQKRMMEELSKLPPTAVADDFGVIMLEGSPRLFHPDLLREGFDGGRKMLSNVLARVKQYCTIDPTQPRPAKYLVQIFLDVSKTAGILKRLGRIDGIGQLQDFLDGLSVNNDLCYVVDVEDNPKFSCPAAKIRESMRLFASIASCKMIFLAATSDKPYLPVLDDLGENEQLPKCYAARSTRHFDDDPFKRLGDHRVIYIRSLFSTSPEEWEHLQEQISRGDMNRPATPETTSPSRSITPVTKNFPTPLLTPPHETSHYLEFNSHESPPPSTRTSSPPLRPAPWSHIPPTQGNWRIASTTGGTLLDQHLARMRPTSPASLTTEVLLSNVTDGGKYKTRPRVPPRSPSSRGTTRTIRQALVVPIDDREGSIAGSPPSSDENRPSVHLPHSAVKRVQRPTSFDARPVSPGSVTSYTPSTVHSVETGPRLPPWGSSRAASGSKRSKGKARADNPNVTPLGGDRRYSGGETTLHGFNVRGGGDPASRRRTREYKYLRALDPPPCHRKYLIGYCHIPGCQYGHDYPIPAEGIAMLRLLAKEMIGLRHGND